MHLDLILLWLQSSADDAATPASTWWRVLILLAGGAATIYSRARMGGGPASGLDGAGQGSSFNLTFGRSSLLDRPFTEAGATGQRRPRAIVPDVPSFDEAVADAEAGLSPEQARSRRIMTAGQSIAELNNGLLADWARLHGAIEQLCAQGQSPAEPNDWQLAGPLSVGLDVLAPEDEGPPPYPLSAEEEAWQTLLKAADGPLALHQQLSRGVETAHAGRKLRGAALTLPGPLSTVGHVLRHAEESLDSGLKPSSRARLRSLVRRFCAGELQQISENLRQANLLDEH